MVVIVDVEPGTSSVRAAILHGNMTVQSHHVAAYRPTLKHIKNHAVTNSETIFQVESSTGFRLPPVISNRRMNRSLGPFGNSQTCQVCLLQITKCTDTNKHLPLERIGVCSFSRQKKSPERGQVELCRPTAVFVQPLDRSQRSGCSEQCRNTMSLCYSPEVRFVGCPHRLAFVQHSGATQKKRAVHRKAVPHHPAYIAVPR